MIKYFKCLILTFALIVPSLSYANGLQNIENKSTKIFDKIILSAIAVDVCDSFLERENPEAMDFAEESHTFEMLDLYGKNKTDSEQEKLQVTIDEIKEELEIMPEYLVCAIATGFIHGVVAAESENFK